MYPTGTLLNNNRTATGWTSIVSISTITISDRISEFWLQQCRSTTASFPLTYLTYLGI